MAKLLGGATKGKRPGMQRAMGNATAVGGKVPLPQSGRKKGMPAMHGVKGTKVVASKKGALRYK